ncbi:odorant receptor 49b [Aethina tumida]|uniref:odorant receptor 49b n=1 Tax=Aethina tumida TaxID=116153 RepID=UPI002148CA9E|nr:odorant receptor 49b [Aethina tumida]
MTAVFETMMCVNMDCFSSSLMIQAGLQCDMMCNTLKNLEKFKVNDDGGMVESDAQDEDTEAYSNRLLKNLIYCVKHHIEIKKWAKDIQDIHSISICFQFGIGSMVLCASLFELSMVNPLSTKFILLSNYYLAILTEIFLYCWFGNELNYKFSALSFSLRMSMDGLIAEDNFKSVLKMPSTDLTIIMAPHVLIFKLYGFWKPETVSSVLRKIFFSSCWLCFWFTQVMFLLTNLNDIKKVTSVSYAVLTFTINLVKMVFIYKNIYKILDMMALLNTEPFRAKCREHEEIFESTKSYYSKVWYFCVFIGLGVDLFWAISPLSMDTAIPFHAWFPFNYEGTEYFKFVYGFQAMTGTIDTMMCVNMDCFSSTLLVQGGIQCDMMCNTLKNLQKFKVNDDGEMVESDAQDEDREAYSDRLLNNLIYCVKHHIEIKKWAKDIQDIHSISICFQFGIGSMVLCASLFELSMVNPLSTKFILLLNYYLAILTEIFLYCWFGNEFNDKSSQLYHSVYECQWMDCNIKFKKAMLIFMMGTEKPITVYVGGLFPMSLPIYVAILRSSYSYFTLLQNVFLK